MLRRSLLAALAAALALAAPASARTILVDDDASPCDAARFTSIQAAVDTARPGDTVKVCAGRYREQVELNTPRVSLVSSPRLGARLSPPDELRIAGDAYNLVSVAADRVRVEGFELRGPLSPPGCDFREDASGVAVAGGTGVVIQRNRFFRLGGSESCFLTGSAIRLGTVACCGSDPGPGVLVQDNQVLDTVSAIEVRSGTHRITRNLLAGSDEGTQFGYAVNGLGGQGVISGNEAYDFWDGLYFAPISGYGPQGWKLVSNHVHDTQYAVYMQGRGHRISRNLLHDNGSGIIFLGSGSLIDRNRLDDNVGGIHLGEFPEPTNPPNLIRDNVVTDSADWDCLDSTGGFDDQGNQLPPVNRWSNNIGARDSPEFLCREP